MAQFGRGRGQNGAERGEKWNRPWYLGEHCHQGQFPADEQLDVKDTDFSPGVRRMQALAGQQGREQMKVLAGLEVTAKSVERTAEAIGADIAQGEQREIAKAVQLDLPVVIGKPIPILYVQMDGTGVPLVKKETEGRKGKTDGQSAHTREVKLRYVFTQTTHGKEGFAIRDPDSTTCTGAIEPPKSSASAFIWKPGTADGAAPARKPSSAMEPRLIPASMPHLPRRHAGQSFRR